METIINDKLSVPGFNLALKPQKSPQVSDNTVLNINLIKCPLKIPNLKDQPSL